MKKLLLALFLSVSTIFASSQCANTSSWGSGNAPTTVGSTTTLSTCSYQSEYSTVNSVVAGDTYSINNTAGGCVTIHSGSATGPVVAFGNVPLSWTPAVGGTYYLSWNTNCVTCGTASPCSTVSITLTTGTGGGGGGGCVGGSNNSCNTADPFCTGTAYNYCNTTGVAGAGTYGCLISTPNPMWMYLNIATGGNIDIFIEQFTTGGTPIDVDFALYGPYGSLAAACPITGATAQVDCSFSAAATETANITGAVPGQWYMLLITNYNGAAGYIEFSQTGGGGSTNCSIVTPCSSSAVGTNPACSGGTGSILVTALGGTPNFNVSWSGTSSGNPGGSEMNAVGGTYTINGLAPGNYTVTVTDASGCVSTNSVTITNPTPVTATQAHTNPLCFGQTTSATITASGSSPGYNVSWTGTTSGNPAGTEIAASGGTYNMTGLGAGTYNVTVTSANGCTGTVTVTVTTPTALTASNVPTHVTCAGLTNGAAAITASGGTAPYNVSWTGASSGNPGGTEIAASGGTYNITGLTNGAYTVTITDANGCTTTTAVTINPGVTIDANITPVAAQCLSGNSFSFSGSPSTISSGTITSYNWNFGAGASPATGTGVNPGAVTYPAAGTYTVTLTASNGVCTNVQTMTITVNANPTVSGTPSNVLCNGGSTGSIAVTSSGGTPGYNISWTGTTTGNPAGTEIAASGGTYNMTSLPAGSYTITSTSANGCTASTVVNITQPTVLSTSDVETNVLCNGGTTGNGAITATGGTAPYNVSWTGTTTGNPGGTEIAASGGTYNMTNLGAGTYNVTVTDANGCTATTTVNITQPTLTTASNTPTNALCSGGTGSAVITASGGTAGYNVSWTGTTSGNPAGTEIAASGGTYTMTALPVGSYTVTVTNANGCTATTTFNINAASALTVSDVETNVTCNGGTNGSGVVTASGGTPGYNVSWTGTTTGNPAGTEIAVSGGSYTMTSLGAGTYNVTVTDASGCTGTTTVTITQPAVLTASDVETNVLCNGGTNGNGAVTATGGTAPYNVSWTGTTSGNPAGNEIAASGGTYNLSSLSVGTYNVTVTDANGCTATTTVNITQPAAITLTPSSTNTNCGSSTGTASVVAAGGAGGYSYVWAPAPGGGQGTANATGLPSGNIAVTVADANGCTQVANIIVGANAAPTGALVSQVNVTCNGGTNGSAIVSSTGGTAPYNVSWTGPTSGNPAGNEIAASGGTYNITPMSAGLYTVTITDAGGCTATVNVTITQPTAIVATNLGVTAVSCNAGSNGTAQINATGGTAPYNVSWTGAATGNPAGTEIAASGGNYTMTGLVAGAYTVTITDANGCTTTTTATITQPTVLTASDVETNVLCNGGTNGSGVVTATGGTAPYNVSWTGTTTGNPAGDEIAASGGTYTLTSLGVGTYNVTVTDANGCTATTTVNITQPSAITLTPSSINANCGASDGTASVVAAGGAGGFSYVWSPAPGGGQGTATATGIPAGSYNVVVTDVNSCTANVNIVVGSNSAPTATEVSNIDILCFGGTNGSILVNSTGGAPGYNVSWSGAAAGNPGGTEIAASGGTYNITGLIVGSYTVTVTDANGCTSTFNTTLTEPALLTASDIENNVPCFGGNNGSAIISANGGTAGYNVSWTGTTTGNPAGTEIATSGGSYAMPALTAGTYNITVTDANGCTATTTANITQPTAISITSATSINALCNGDCNGSVNASATGGTGTLVYNWVTVGTGANQSGLCAGTYNLIVTDDNNCSANQTVIVGEPTVVTATTSTVNANCGSADGSATVTPAGGMGGYTYSWNTVPVQTTQTATGLIPGSYNVIVTDANGCDITVTATVGNNTAGSANAVTDNNVSCFGAADGQMTATMTGGAAPFNYSWNTVPVQTTATATNVGPGTYTVSITDDNGCVVVTTATVTEPPLLTVSTLATDVSCPAGSDGTVTATVAGGTPNYTYSWTSGQTTQNISGLIANSYTITVTDDNGCTATSSATVNQPAAFNLTFTNTDVLCKSACTGVSVANITGGTSPYSYQWDDALLQTTQTALFLCAGNYNVVITDDNGCTFNGSTTINEPTQLILNSTFVNANCGQADGEACVLISGGVAPYNVLWNTGQTTTCLTNVVAGTYVATVTDANGCSEVITVTVLDLGGPSASIIAQTNPSCFGFTDGSATVDMIGGTGFFTVLWDPAAGSQTTPTASNLGAGTYAVTITDAVGCSASASVTIIEPDDIIYIPTTTDASCYNYCDGVISIAVVGGTTPYNYSWLDASNNPVGTNSSSVTGLCDGSYNLVLTDAQGCLENVPYTINEPVQITGTISSTNVVCNGACDGTATIVSGNGVPPFTYSWNDPSTQTTSTANGLCPGNYDVTLTDDHGCFEVFSTSITEPTLLTSSITIFGDVSCSGSCDGFAQVDFAGGVGPYQILWSNATSNQVATNLCTGTYTATITDANGCTSVSSITISTPNPIVLTTTQVDLLCNNLCIGEVHATVTGGTTPYNYQWDNPTFSTTPSILNQCAGTYTVLVTDDNGCTSSATVTVTEPQALDFTYTSQNSNCMQPNGQICTSVSGGVAPFFYQWDDPFLQTSACAFNIVAGCYNVTLTDGNGCIKDSLICINDIAGPAVSLTSTTDVTCQGANDGSIVVNASGGVGTLSIEWQDGTGTTIPAYADMTSVTILNGDTYGIIVTDTAGCVATLTEFVYEPNSVFSAITAFTEPLCFGGCDGTATVSASGGDNNYSYQWNAGSASTSANNTGLCAGSVSVTVTDGNGCAFTTDTIITQPTQITASTVSTSDVTCFGYCDGTIIVTANGATPPYSYSWTLGVSTGPSAMNLCPNTYTTVITDQNGCFTAENNTITEPGALTVSTTTVNSTCTQCNGEATATVNGGTSPFNYQWSSGASLNTPGNTGLCPGPHTIDITDGNGCTVSGTATIIDEAGPVITGMTFTAPLCFGLSNGSATVNTSGGTGQIMYSWTDPSSQNTQTAFGLVAGNYCVSIEDQNGCPASQCITVTQPNPLNAIGDLDATICFGDSTQVWASGQGGTSPYTINWTSPGMSGSGPIMVQPAVSTDYCFTVTDANGCNSPNDCVEITVTPPLTLTLTPPSEICDQDDITLTATAAGGNGDPYIFTWTDDAGNPVTETTNGNTSTITVNPSTATTYYVTLTDGCSTPVIDSTTVSVNALPSLFVNVVDPDGCVPFTAQFIVNSDIGVTYDYDFQCDGSSDYSGTNTNTTFTYPTAGTFDVCVTATSADGCVTTLTSPGMVTVYPLPVADFSFTPNETTILNPTISFTDQSSGGDSIVWDFGDGYILSGYTNSGTVPNGTHDGLTSGTYLNPEHTYIDSGYYQITQTIVNTTTGCSQDITYTLHVEGDYILFAPSSFTPNGDGTNDLFFPQGVGINRDHFKMMIFNRWGELIYETENPEAGWDGTYKGLMSQTDVYVWKIQAKDHKNIQHDYIGHVTLLR
jgi:gliding motility-associated-like protein